MGILGKFQAKVMNSGLSFCNNLSLTECVGWGRTLVQLPPMGPLTCWVLWRDGGTVRVGSCLALRTSPAAQRSWACSERARRGAAERLGSRGHCSSLGESWTVGWGPVPASCAYRGPVTRSLGGLALGPCLAWPLPCFPRVQPQPLACWVGGRSLQDDLIFLGSVGA